MDNLVPIFGIFFIFGAPIIAFVIMRVLAHRERIEMIRRGFIPTADKRTYRGGFAPPPPPFTSREQPQPHAQPEYYDVASAQRALRGGIITTFVGFAIFIGLSFIGYHSAGAFGTPTIEPGPWLLGGLIPMFIGIAQLIIALISGARFGIPVNPSTDFGAANRSAEPPQPNVSGNYYEPPHPQPRATAYEELKRPVPPPDLR